MTPFTLSTLALGLILLALGAGIVNASAFGGQRASGVVAVIIGCALIVAAFFASVP